MGVPEFGASTSVSTTTLTPPTSPPPLPPTYLSKAKACVSSSTAKLCTRARKTSSISKEKPLTPKLPFSSRLVVQRSRYTKCPTCGSIVLLDRPPTPPLSCSDSSDDENASACECPFCQTWKDGPDLQEYCFTDSSSDDESDNY